MKHISKDYLNSSKAFICSKTFIFIITFLVCAIILIRVDHSHKKKLKILSEQNNHLHQALNSTKLKEQDNVLPLDAMYEAARNNDLDFIQKNLGDTSSLYKRSPYFDGPVARLFANLATNHYLDKNMNLIKLDRDSYQKTIDLVKQIKIPGSNEKYYDLSRKQDELVEQIKKIYMTEETSLVYNPSAVIYKDKIVMSFRLDEFNPDIANNTFILIAEFDLDLKLISKPQKLVSGLCSLNNCRAEDARLFVMNNELYAIFNYDIEILDKKISVNREMKIAKIVSEQGKYIVENVTRLISPFNKQTEKNWAPLIFKNELYLVYSIDPEFIIFKPDLQTGFCKVVVTQKNDINFQFGELRNSTNFIEIKEGEFLGFLHTHIPDSLEHKHWYYFVFASKIICKNTIETCAIERTLEAPLLFNYAPYARMLNHLYISSILKQGKNLFIFAGVNDVEAVAIKLNSNSFQQLLKKDNS